MKTLRDYLSKNGTTLSIEALHRTFITLRYRLYQPECIREIKRPQSTRLEKYLNITKPNGEKDSIPLRNHLDDIALPDLLPRFDDQEIA